MHGGILILKSGLVFFNLKFTLTGHPVYLKFKFLLAKPGNAKGKSVWPRLVPTTVAGFSPMLLELNVLGRVPRKQTLR